MVNPSTKMGHIEMESIVKVATFGYFLVSISKQNGRNLKKKTTFNELKDMWIVNPDSSFDYMKNLTITCYLGLSGIRNF